MLNSHMHYNSNGDKKVLCQGTLKCMAHWFTRPAIDLLDENSIGVSSFLSTYLAKINEEVPRIASWIPNGKKNASVLTAFIPQKTF